MDNIPRIEKPQSKKILEKQIKALKYIISQDKNEKDKQIHEQALRGLEAIRRKNKKTEVYK